MTEDVDWGAIGYAAGCGLAQGLIQIQIENSDG